MFWSIDTCQNKVSRGPVSRDHIAGSSLELTEEHSGQTSAHAQMDIFCQPRANFPRKILKENIGNNRCNAKSTKQNWNVHRNL